jgi:hypothetical protein
MREFFRGWRRKAGCVALVMACVVTGCSLRARIVCDEFLFGNGHGAEIRAIGLHRVGIKWTVYEDPAVVFSAGWNSHPYAVGGDSFEKVLREHPREWEWRISGFSSGQIRNISSDGDRLTFQIVPYWFLIIPLTLLSAYLILWKPRKNS